MSSSEACRSERSNVEDGANDLRKEERVALSAVAEVMDRRSGARIPARVADISRNGCYADTLNVFPIGTEVILSVRHADLDFKTAAIVVYALPSMGMGLYFSETAPEMCLVLEKWLAEARGEMLTTFGLSSFGRKAEPVPQYDEQRVLQQLVELLMRKGLLTQTEGLDLLAELSHKR